MSNECTHTRQVSGSWVFKRKAVWDDDYDGYVDGDVWEEGYEEQTVVDIGLHSYKCTQCGKVFYYSQAAKEHFEDGKSFDIKGLE